jgi:hypothetical protein
MKSTYFLVCFASALLFTGCAAVYQTEQTPDDLYYSPATVTPKAKDVVASNQDNDARFEEYISSSDDRYLRMKVANRNRWDVIDDYSYWNDSRFDFYGYNYYNNFYGNNYFNNSAFYPGFNFGFNNFYGFGGYQSIYNYGNGFNGFNIFNNGYYGGFYNPYYSLASYKNINAPRGYTSGSNISAYRNGRYNNTNNFNLPPSPQPRRDNSNSFGNLIRRAITPPANSPSGTPSTTVDRPSRTFTPSGSAPSSNTGGSSGGFGSSGSSSDAPRKPRG